MDIGLIKQEISEENPSISESLCIMNPKPHELHSAVKLEESELFSPIIPKSEELLLKDESAQDYDIIKPLPTEEIYLKDELVSQPSCSGLKGISRLNNSYVCDVCQYQSMDVMKLKTHVVVHIQEKPFKCSECDFEISSKFDLTFHILNQHSEIFRCIRCRYTTTMQDEIEKHMGVHDVEEKEHMKILAAEKPFKCEHCEYRAAKEYILKKHMMKHFPDNCFKCNECSFNTLLKNKLQDHKKTHKKRKRVD